MSAFLTILLTGLSITAADDGYVYRLSSIRAAPGTLLETIDLLQQRHSALANLGYPESHIMRHSQGDHWDLLVITPVGQMGEYFSSDRVEERQNATRGFDAALDRIVAWEDEVYLTGPNVDIVSQNFGQFDFYHIEMMISAPGSREALYREREMENDYSRRVGRPENLIFDRVAGAAWEVITIGFYRDIQHFAEGTPDFSDEERESAAVAAGFPGRDFIGTYLRSLMSYHRDTLAGAVR